MKFSKKILSVLMSFCTLFFMPIGKVNADDFVNILVVCEDDYILQQFCDYIKKYEYIARNEESIISSKGYPTINIDDYEKRVNLIPVVCKYSYAENILPHLEDSCQVIILYDISDSSLNELIEKHTMINSDEWQYLLKMDTFLNECIRLTMSEHIRPNWV